MIRTFHIPVFPATIIWAPLLSKLTCFICRPKISPTRKPPSYRVMISALSRGRSAFSVVFSPHPLSRVPREEVDDRC